MQFYLFFVIAFIWEVLCNVQGTAAGKYQNPYDTTPRYRFGSTLQCGTRNVSFNYLDRENHPWVVKLLYKYPKISRCGGVLVADQWVLSSAECIRSDELQAVLVGEYDTSHTWDCVCPDKTGILQKSSIHQKVFNDAYGIGLLNFKPVKFNDHVYPICVPRDSDLAFPGKIGRVSGWSYLASHNYLHKEYMQSTDMIIINNTVCNQILNTTLPSYKFCAKQIGEPLPCVPMPGSPFMEYWTGDDKFYAVGIMLEEASECDTTKPIVFMETSELRYWIQNIILEDSIFEW